MHTSRLLCTGLLLLFSVLLAACSSSKPDKPESVVEDLFKAIAKQDVDKVVALCALGDVPENQRLRVNGKIQVIVGGASAHMQANGGLKRVDILESTLADDGQTAAVRATVIFNNDKEEAAPVRLRREDGKWKIVM